MSRKRNRHLSQSSVLDRTSNSLQNKSKPIFGASTSKSFYIPGKSSLTIQSNRIDFTDYKRQKLFNKQGFIKNRNVSFFRDISGQDNPGMLHFMSSLRQNKTIDNSQRRVSDIEPFQCSMKSTMNQTFRKKIFQSTAKQTRVASAYYRWHNKSGNGTTCSVNFQCSLRDYKMGMNPEQQKFDNLIKPIKYYQDVQVKQYDQKDIFCPKQRRLFRLKAK